jgi:hypothetical protein
MPIVVVAVSVLIALAALFSGPLFRPSMRQVLSTADTIEFSRTVYGRKQTARLDQKTAPDLIRALRTSGGFHKTRPESQPDVSATVLSFGGRSAGKSAGQFEYIMRTGEIGRDGEWCLVPSEVRNYLQRRSSWSAR